jgi:hypothetical protein
VEKRGGEEAAMRARTTAGEAATRAQNATAPPVSTDLRVGTPETVPSVRSGSND